MCEQKGNRQIWCQTELGEKRGRWEAGSCGCPGEAKGQGVDENWGHLGENRPQSQARTKNPPAALLPRPHIPHIPGDSYPSPQGPCPRPALALCRFRLITTQVSISLSLCPLSQAPALAALLMVTLGSLPGCRNRTQWGGERVGGEDEKGKPGWRALGTAAT